MTYVSPIHRAVPLPHPRSSDDVPDAPCPLPVRRGEFDRGILGEDWVKAQLPGNDLLPNEDKLVGFTPREPSLLDKHREKVGWAMFFILGFITFGLLMGALNLYLTGAV